MKTRPVGAESFHAGRRTGGRTDGRADERTDGRTGGRTDGRTDGRTNGRAGGRTDGRADERTDGRADERTNRHDEANSRFSQFCERASKSHFIVTIIHIITLYGKIKRSVMLHHVFTI
jgi:hypothetical protein